MPESSIPDWLTQILGRTDAATRLIQTILTASGLFGLVATAWAKSPIQFGLSIAVFVMAAVWVVVGAYLRRRKPKKLALPIEQRSASSYLRGLLPFENGEGLLGRDQEVGQLLALVRSLEYRFGFLSGEAGAGKTSLLRSRLVPELEKNGWQPIYVSRTGADPITAVHKELVRARLLPEPLADTVRLRELLKRTSEAISEKTLFLILDQFEEFFILNRTHEARRTFESELGSVADAAFPMRMLFALRKEFVDDLLDFAKMAPSLGEVRWRQPLHNFSIDTARLVIHKVVAVEGLQFSDELQEQVVNDLARNERVRPVEFQLVFTTLLNQSVFDIASYGGLGGAQGVIARLIAQLIEPPDLKISETERRAARYALRALCNKEFTTRRPIGLSREDIATRILADMEAGGQPPVARVEVEAALDRVLHRFLGSFILILEDEEKYNLAHDYLASPIRDATAEIETVEERADRLLDQFLEQQRAFGRLVVPWNKLRYIRNFASPEALQRTEAAALIRHSIMRFRIMVAGAAFAALVILTLLLPFGEYYPYGERLEIVGERILSRNGHTLLVFNNDKVSFIRLNAAHFDAVPSSVPALGAVVSPAGDQFMLLGKDGALYRVRADNEFKPEKLIDDLGWQNPVWARFRRDYSWAGYSADGNWVFAVKSDGRIYTWPANGRPQQLVRLSAMTDEFGRPIDVSKPTNTEKPAATNNREPIPPTIQMSADGTFLAVIDGEGHLYVIDCSKSGQLLPSELLSLQQAFGRKYELESSLDGKWLAVGGAGDIYVIRLNPKAKLTTQLAISFQSEAESNWGPQVVFSPGNDWLIARKSFGNFYTAQLTDPMKAQSFPAVESMPSSSESGERSVSFSADAKFVAGKARDGRIYAWRLDKPPGSTAKPLLPSGGPQQVASFCKQTNDLLVGSSDGSIFTTGAEIPSKLTQIGRLAGSNIHFRFAAGDKNQIFVFDDFRLEFGECGHQLTKVLEYDSSIIDITGTQGSLALISNHDIVRVKREFRVLGIPVWPLDWPSLTGEKN